VERVPFFLNESETMSTVLIKNGRLADGTPSDIFIRDEYIVQMGTGMTPPADRIIDATGMLVFPGLIDVHTHIRDMGQAEKETWLSASRAAAKGGVTTICDMPNTVPATFDSESLKVKMRAAEKSIVNYGINFGVTEKNASEIRKADPINALKVFMAGSSGGYVVQDETVLRDVFALAVEVGKPLMVHSELQDCVEGFADKFEPTITNHHLLRNRACAIKATEMLLRIAADYRAELYLAHISTLEEIDMIREAKKSNSHIHCEVTPQHLFINTNILEDVGNFGKVNPPLRLTADNKALQEAVIDGTADCIGSDHAPHTPEEKKRSYSQAPSGFPGLETSLSLMLQMVSSGQIEYTRLQEMMCGNPASIFGMKKRGVLKQGFYADIILIDPQKKWTVQAADFETKAHYSPYEGMLLRGCNQMTLVNGRVVYEKGNFYENRGMAIEY